jgi:hypothetical protein
MDFRKPFRAVVARLTERLHCAETEPIPITTVWLDVVDHRRHGRFAVPSTSRTRET